MAEPQTVLANLHERRGEWVEADRLYDKALALDPDDPTSRLWRANNLSRAGYQVEARVHRQRALALDPMNVAAHWWLAMQRGSRWRVTRVGPRRGDQSGGAGCSEVQRISMAERFISHKATGAAQSSAGTGISKHLVSTRERPNSWSKR